MVMLLDLKHLTSLDLDLCGTNVNLLPSAALAQFALLRLVG
jgi:hypothetical protein